MLKNPMNYNDRAGRIALLTHFIVYKIPYVLTRFNVQKLHRLLTQCIFKFYTAS